ncbi:bifunctional DNA primase/polymerase [Zooshikella ganghwensis]|uniref:bifunctional DNA primase/polymerase n=1 Tax=Zooshikella ganghwensis TaxID=202772 RepID=UPI000426D8FD|nr:bifunctional DNA primase/polymerase [Zooshikella ganghwensis]
MEADKPPITEETAWEPYDRGFTVIPLGSPFETPPPYFVNKRFDGNKEKAQQEWPKQARVPWAKYQKVTPSLEDMDYWTASYPRANWAIVTGAHVIVVDADSEEAVQFMESGTVGRTPWKVKTGKGKHFYYAVNPNVEIRNSVNPHSKIDIRGLGGYVVAPGSTHANGSRYEWEYDASWVINSIDDLPCLSEDDLQAIQQFNGRHVINQTKADATKTKATTEVKGNLGFSTADYQPKASGEAVSEGSRNQSAVSLTGQYIASGMDLRTIKQMLDTWNAGNSPPLNSSELNTCIASTVMTHLRKHPHDVIPVQLAPPEPAKASNLSLHDSGGMPGHLYDIPGVLGEVVQFANQTARRKQPALAVQSALALGSVVCGRYYKTDKGNFSSLYFLNIAKSASGKEHCKDVVEQILEASGYGRLISGSGYTSSGALFSELLHEPNHISIIDEFGKYLEGSQHKMNPHKAEAITRLVEAWSKCGSSLYPPVYSTMGMSKQAAEEMRKRCIKHPALTLLALTTPGTFYGALSPELVKDGFLGRFIVMESQLKRQVSSDPGLIEVPENITKWVATIRENLAGNLTSHMPPENKPAQNILVFEESALQRLKALDQEIIQKMDELEQYGIEVLLGRTREKAMRIALILALSVDPFAETITRQVTDWAVDYVTYFDYALVQSVIKKVGGSSFETLLKSCEEALRLAGKKGLTKREMARHPNFSKLDPRQEEAFFKTFLNRGLAQLLSLKTSGRPRQAWVHYTLVENAGGPE